MKLNHTLAAAAVLALLGTSLSAQAYDADWKRGRVYYRAVCTTCHLAAPIGSINPSTKTKAEWAAYLKADKHAKGKDTVKEYVSKAYRAKIKAGNKAAEKFADAPDQELLDDVAAFLNKGAKDGDAPASCSWIVALLAARGAIQPRGLPRAICRQR
ncbi:MAG: c-type cytochrome [Betaproteobacteria bacterium]|nr:c-type cytochrome [Betaproteobacteria bacterium]